METLKVLGAATYLYALTGLHLEMTGEEQEEYATMLLWLQNQVEMGDPNPKIVERSRAWLNNFIAIRREEQRLRAKPGKIEVPW